MATPEGHIEITDFSPGIHGDIYASTNEPRSTATSFLKGSIPGPGVARVENTFRCYADATGALVPLPKNLTPGPAQLTPDVTDANVLDGERQGFIAPWLPSITDNNFTDPNRRGVYLLDAAIAPANQVAGLASGLDISHDAADQLGVSIFGVWGYWYDAAGSVGGTVKPFVHGREFRTWRASQIIAGIADDVAELDAISKYDFLFQKAGGQVLNGESYKMPLPAASITNGRFYYGYTSSGVIDAAGSNQFRFDWWFPVMIVVAATPSGHANENWFANVAPSANELALLNHVITGAATQADPYSHFSPTIGVSDGTCVIGMNFNNQDTGNVLPLPSTHHQWYYRRGDEGYAFDFTDHVPDLRYIGPWNPYMAIFHQGRLVLADRRRSERVGADRNGAGTVEMYRSLDDLLWFSDVYLPMQDFKQTPDSPVSGITNAAFGNYPAATHLNYKSLAVADDVNSEIGTLGVVSVDQILVVKHYGGGAIVSGDLEQPTVRRLPFIEPTRGAVAYGCMSPLGFVYGSKDGIFAWQGGDQSEKLSNQIEGFFWDHTSGVHELQNQPAAEEYGGSRGRFAYWNHFICVPNNYLMDVRTGGWWRFGSTTVTQAELTLYPYNIYLEDHRGRLFACSYKAVEQVVSIGGGQFGWLPWLQIYDPTRLDNYYSWQSHPLMETRGRILSFQDVKVVATQKESMSSTITVTLSGFNRDGTPVTPVSVVLGLLSQSTDSLQILRKDIVPNFTAEYVTLRLEANSNAVDVPAPKIHSVQLGYKDRATTVRHG